MKGLGSFNLLSDAVFEDNMLKVSPGGYAGQTLVNSYADALTQSRYLYIRAEAYIKNIDNSYNYNNSVEIVITGFYSLGGQAYTYYKSVPFTLLGQEISSGNVILDRIVSMPNIDFIDLKVYFKNNSKSTATLISISILRSQDISSSQIADAINTNVGLVQVVYYANGFELYYENSPRPVRIWWIGDRGVLEGLDVNHQKIINITNRGLEEMI